MSSLCPFCVTPIPPELDAEIIGIESQCPSECDGVIYVDARCPACGRVFWSRQIPAGYNVQRLALFVPRIKVAPPVPPSCDYHMLQEGGYLVEDDGILYNAIISLDVAEATIRETSIANLGTIVSLFPNTEEVHRLVLARLVRDGKDHLNRCSGFNDLLQVVWSMHSSVRAVVAQMLEEWEGERGVKLPAGWARDYLPAGN